MKGNGVAVAGAVVAAVVAIGISSVARHDRPPPLRRANPVRVTAAAGCPATVARFDGVRNPDASRLDRALVPPDPARVLVCRYAPGVSGESGGLSHAVRLEVGPAKRLAQDLRSVESFGSGDYSCGAGTTTRVDLLAFSYRGRSDVDVWFEQSGCTTLENGYLVLPEITPKVMNEFDDFIKDLDKAVPSG